ncbi:MAG: PAS domain S-box protein, partial [Chthoniobacteraceae bacterium]
MPSSASLPASPLRIRKRTIFLLLTVSVLMGGGLWALFHSRTTFDEARAARRKSITAVSEAALLRGQLATLFTVSVKTEPQSADHASRVHNALRAFSDQVTKLRSSIDEPAAMADLDQLEADANWIAEASVPPAGPPPADGTSIRAEANEILTDATTQSEALEVRLNLHARAMARQLDLATKHSRRIESAVLGLLLALIGGAVYSLWRLVGRMHAEKRARALALDELRESESKYHSIFDHAVEGIFHATPEGHFIVANRTLARMYGYGTPERFIQHVPDIAKQLYVEQKQRSALLLALLEEDVISNFEFEVERADGRSIWLRENIRAVRDENRRVKYLEGTVEDISDRWWAEQRRRLQFATSRALNEAATVADARPMILQSICEILEWDLGAVWDVDVKSMVLRCMEIWHSPSVEVQDFERANTTTTYAPGHGLAGEVWKSGEPRWFASLNHVTSFPNAAIAVRAGMRSAFGVPIMVAGEVRH